MKTLYLIITLILTSSCSGSMLKYGKVKRYKSSSNSQAFLFKVEEGFLKHGDPVERDTRHLLMNKDEARLLNRLLVNKKLCLDGYNYPSYVITSKQEKIYDVTFANLIERNYNARPVSPLTYYGHCT